MSLDGIYLLNSGSLVCFGHGKSASNLVGQYSSDVSARVLQDQKRNEVLQVATLRLQEYNAQLSNISAFLDQDLICGHGGTGCGDAGFLRTPDVKVRSGVDLEAREASHSHWKTYFWVGRFH